MKSVRTGSGRTRIGRSFACALVALLLALLPALASTPKLKIKLKHNSEIEKRKLAQIERLAAQYDLSKYTRTRDIVIEQGAVAHSSPVLTLNGRFLDNDDLALSQYVHEQGHWVLMQDRMDMPELYRELKTFFPGLPVRPPEGDGQERSTYFHVAVIMLEWQALEDLVGPERARRVMEWKKGDHYIAIYATVLEHRATVEKILQQFGIHF